MFRHRRRSEVPSLNTSSTADISFMLLIFFLVTSSMDAGKGLKRQLPPPPQEQEQVADIQKEDILTITLSADGQLTMDGEPSTLPQLLTDIHKFAAVNPHHRVVAISVDPQTHYNDYFELQNAIVAAYKPLKCQPRISETVEPTTPPTQQKSIAPTPPSAQQKGGRQP
jgi:biopolymer transport protein ExbD